MLAVEMSGWYKPVAGAHLSGLKAWGSSDGDYHRNGLLNPPSSLILQAVVP